MLLAYLFDFLIEALKCLLLKFHFQNRFLKSLKMRLFYLNLFFYQELIRERIDIVHFRGNVCEANYQ